MALGTSRTTWHIGQDRGSARTCAGRSDRMRPAGALFQRLPQVSALPGPVPWSRQQNTGTAACRSTRSPRFTELEAEVERQSRQLRQHRPR